MSPQSHSAPGTTPERVIQKHFFQWLGAYPAIRAVSFAIPNGGTRNLREAIGLKAQGVTPGVPDIFIGVPYSDDHVVYHGLFIELKSDNGRVSPSQRKMIAALRDNDYRCDVCFSLDEAIELATDYLGVRIHARSRTIKNANNSACAKGNEPI